MIEKCVFLNKLANDYLTTINHGFDRQVAQVTNIHTSTIIYLTKRQFLTSDFLITISRFPNFQCGIIRKR